MSSENDVAERLLAEARKKTAKQDSPKLGKISLIIGIICLSGRALLGGEASVVVATTARSRGAGPYGPATTSSAHQVSVCPSRKDRSICTHAPGVAALCHPAAWAASMSFALASSNVALPDRIDAAEPEMVASDVGHDGHVVAVVAEPLAQDPAARDLEDRGIDGRVLEDHQRRLRPRHVALLDEPAIDHDAVGRGHPDAPTHQLQDVRDHPDGRRLPVRAGDRDDRDPS